MLSETRFDQLELLKKAEIDENNQIYEEVDGFESLRKMCTD